MKKCAVELTFHHDPNDFNMTLEDLEELAKWLMKVKWKARKEWSLCHVKATHGRKEVSYRRSLIRWVKVKAKAKGRR